MELHYKAWIEHNGATVFGEGLHELLTLVDQHGSLAAGAAAMGLAYREAWGRVRAAETALGGSLLKRHAGGRGGGGATLTPLGRTLLARFEAIAAGLSTEAQRLQVEFLGDLLDPAAAAAMAPDEQTER